MSDDGPAASDTVTAPTNRLREILDAAILTTDSPHVDLSEFFAGHTVKVGLSDLHELLSDSHAIPAVKLELGDATLTVRRQDGGMMATLDVKW